MIIKQHFAIKLHDRLVNLTRASDNSNQVIDLRDLKAEQLKAVALLEQIAEAEKKANLP
jgi:hypothetical protein